MSALLTHDIPPDAGWSLLVRRGRAITFTALDDGANLSLLLFAAHDPVDRLNIPDTLKAQMRANVAPPMVLMSDRGVGLTSVTASSLDWHDCISGHSLDVHVPASSYAAERNGWKRSARSLLVSELRKHGRDEDDLHACVNLFSKVALDDDAQLTFVDGHARAGDTVTLRAEVDLLLVASTAPHPLDLRWSPGAVRVEITEAAPYGADDPSMRFRAESAHALEQARAVLA
ncbi:MAG: DUF1989 domain-containing protein [Jatrophihabitans sp.]|uniref:DUF1989 domain-containing protein n=1 Tax=Jatrophihabitans sp. TaxID=1932789 RepID=UPI003F7F65B9